MPDSGPKIWQCLPVSSTLGSCLGGALRSDTPSARASDCDAGKLIYVFADGLTAVCPYLVFAARTPQSAYPDSNFLVGNILDGEVAESLDRYDLASRLGMGANDTCRSCAMEVTCGKGCPAALISRGQQIGEVDSEQCPVVSSPLPQIGPRPR